MCPTLDGVQNSVTYSRLDQSAQDCCAIYTRFHVQYHSEHVTIYSYRVITQTYIVEVEHPAEVAVLGVVDWEMVGKAEHKEVAL